MTRLPISAVVVCRNEVDHLRRCLPLLAFCEEIIVFDLESSDGSSEVAARQATRVIRTPAVPIVEQVRTLAPSECTHDWMLFVDPDEECLPGLGAQIVERFPTWATTATAVELPLVFFFRDTPLTGGPWGGIHHKRRLVHRRHYRFTGSIHDDLASCGAESVHRIPYAPGVYFKHKWMRSWPQLLEKHRRYVPFEVAARVRTASPVQGRNRFLAMARNLHYYLVRADGIRDGMLGLVLAAFWCWYHDQIRKGTRARVARVVPR